MCACLPGTPLQLLHPYPRGSYPPTRSTASPHKTLTEGLPQPPHWHVMATTNGHSETGEVGLPGTSLQPLKIQTQAVPF